MLNEPAPLKVVFEDSFKGKVQATIMTITVTMGILKDACLVFLSVGNKGKCYLEAEIQQNEHSLEIDNPHSPPLKIN